MEEERHAAIRRAALLRPPWAAPLPVLPVLGLLALQRRMPHLPFRKWLAVAVALSALPLLTALLEWVAGCELRELSARWDALAGWQRGIAGTLVAAGALAILGTIAFAVAVSMVP